MDGWVNEQTDRHCQRDRQTDSCKSSNFHSDPKSYSLCAEDRRLANGDPEGLIFLSYPHTNNGYFFLLTTVFIYLF